MDFDCGFSLDFRAINAGIQPVCWNKKEEHRIPLLLSPDDIRKSEKLLNDLNGIMGVGVQFDLFTMAVTGAIVTAMKYGS